ncbi:hypothetical protein ACEI25_002968 [Photobacterium damselae]
MKFNKTLIATSLLAALTLSGCGSDSNNSDTSTPPTDSKTKTITVIDGYLAEAEVCADKNNNKLCDNGESIGLTNEKGQLTVSKELASYPLIAKVIAGKTKDSDSIGYVANSYTMGASKELNVITPFTTMAHNDNISLDELASQLNLDSKTISGDYVANKATNKEATKAHLIARSVTSALPENLTQLNKDQISKVVTAAQKTIEKHENNGTLSELDDVRVVIDEAGNVEEQELVNNLHSYLTSKDAWFLGSMNQGYMNDEGIQKAIYKEDGTSEWFEQDGTSSGKESFKVDGNHFIEADGSKGDEFIFTSPNLALTVASGDGNDLLFWTPKTLDDTFTPELLTKNQFENKTWFFVGDDSTSHTPEPMMAEMKFSPLAENGVGTVTITENGESFEITWQLKEFNEFGQHNVLFLDFPEGDSDMKVMPVTKGNGLMLVSDLARQTELFNLFVDSKEQAETIIKKWVNAQQ